MAIEQNNPSLILTSGASGRVNALLSLRALKYLIALAHAFILILLVPFRGRKRTVVIEDKQESGSVRKTTPKVRVPTTIVPWKSSTGLALGLEQEVVARRSLAMMRVMQDRDENTVREFSLFVTPRGDTMFTQSWTPAASDNVRYISFAFHFHFVFIINDEHVS